PDLGATVRVLPDRPGRPAHRDRRARGGGVHRVAAATAAVRPQARRKRSGMSATGALALLPALDRCRVIGVVNVTPDSFSDGGRHADTAAAVRHGLSLLD